MCERHGEDRLQAGLLLPPGPGKGCLGHAINHGDPEDRAPHPATAQLSYQQCLEVGALLLLHKQN